MVGQVEEVKFNSPIAQLVEQQTVNLWVTRSSRVRGAKVLLVDDHPSLN